MNEEAQYIEKYAVMAKKICPYFKEACLMERCIAFAGEFDKTREILIEPHCQMFIPPSELLSAISHC